MSMYLKFSDGDILITVLSSTDIKPRHCVVRCTNDRRVDLTRQDGHCYVNTEEVADKRQLFHG